MEEKIISAPAAEQEAPKAAVQEKPEKAQPAENKPAENKPAVSPWKMAVEQALRAAREEAEKKD